VISLIDKVMGFADKYDMLPETGLVIACVSGGADSMCLLKVLLDISRRRGFSVEAAHFNHGLRGTEADGDESFVRDYCSARGVLLHCGRGDVGAHARERKLGLEEAARDLRYGFFSEVAVATGAARIATAHTADDNAETILLNLARGAGANGLSGIPPVRELAGAGETGVPPSAVCRNDAKIIRPMLGITRDDVMKFIGERSIPFREDSTNCLDIYTRNRLRHKVVPVLREINPEFSRAAGAAAELARADEEVLSGLADEFINGKLKIENGKYLQIDARAVSVDAKELASLPFAVSSRVIRKLCGGSLSLVHVKSVLELCGRGCASKSLSLPGTTVFREYDRIVFGGDSKPPGGDGAWAESINVYDDCSVVIGVAGLRMTCVTVVCTEQDQLQDDDTINKSFSSFLFKKVDICGKIAVRPRLEGDFLRLPDRNCTKTLKKLFIESRIPVRYRALIPVVADDKGILAVYGLGRGDRAVPAPGDLAFRVDFFTICPVREPLE